ncbi:MAG: glycosyltransferase [Candidatus Eremiobacteraeota bacterium]|nr:glycosyltransferase [Candidatus Eremiobacteraeota bacterium]
MRILVISRHMPAAHILPVDHGGGTDSFIRSVIDLSRRFSDLQIDVATMEPDGSKIVPPAGVRIEYFRSPLLKRLLWQHREARNPIASIALLCATAFGIFSAALQLTKNTRYDLLYAIGGPIAGFAGIMLKRLTGTPLAMHFQYAYRFSGASLPVRRLVRIFYNQADALIGNCALQARDATALGVSAKKCHAIYNWIDAQAFRPLPMREELRAKWGVEPAQTAFFFGGRFDYTKHVDRIIAALRDFDAPGPLFFFAGDGVLRPALDELAANRTNIRVLGTIPQERLVELHNVCDVAFWGSVDIDYPGLVTMEAMFSGLPVVTSNETMNPLYAGARVDEEFLGVPRFARLYPPTIHGIQRAIVESVERRPELNAMRDEVAAFARGQFGFQNAVRLVDVLAATAKVSAPAVAMSTSPA